MEKKEVICQVNSGKQFLTVRGWFRPDRKISSRNINLLTIDFCYECLDGDYDIANVLRPNSDYWASNLKEDDDNVPVDIILNLRASYQLSGFYIELGSGLIPERIEIFKMFEGDTEVFPLHVIDFTGSCKTPDFIDSGGWFKFRTHLLYAWECHLAGIIVKPFSDTVLCQSELGIHNNDMYVNLLTRRPDHFNFRNSTKLQNFVAANEIIFRLYGKLNNDDLKASEKYYSLRNWFTL